MNPQQCKLEIGDIVIKYSEETTVTVDDNSYVISLLSLRYHKKMFEPGKIDAAVQLQENSTSADKKVPTKFDVIRLFSGKSVSLSDDKGTVVKDYYVYKAQPVFRRSSDGRYVYITLQIYSPDHKLTLDNYCKTYVNCKLGGDILTNAMKKADDEKDQGILTRAGFTDETVDFNNNLHFLEYLVKEEEIQTEGDKKITKITKREFIQPYLVQYNECFYDLVARTANRCGEFFYYEDGILRMGLKEPQSADEVKNINPDTALTVSYDDEANTSLLFKDTIQERVYVNGMGVSAGENAKEDYALNDEVPVDEYLINAVKKDEFGDVFKLGFKSGPHWALDALNALLRMSSWTSMVTQLGVKYLDAWTTAVSIANQLDEKGNEQWVKSEDGTDKNIHASEQYDSSTETATLYGSMLTKEIKEKNYSFQQNLNAKFYQFINRGCKAVSEHLISLNLGASLESHMLGDTVTLNNSDDVSDVLDHYIVVEVSEVIKSETQNAQKEDWQIGEKVVLTPHYFVSVKKGEEGEDNTSSDISLELSIPPTMLPAVKSAGPQLAYVAESEDPLGFGRVCIRYPWQKEDDPSSPWIRMMVPFAPHDTEENGGGMYFQPSEGDEVMVDYENGNIERPYVLGSFFTNRTKSPKKRLTSKAPQGERTIASKKGHSIQFDDGDTLSDFMGAMAPTLGLVQKYARYFDGENVQWGVDSCLSGGMTLTDRMGFYKISASTTERTINISCPFGEVGINAFTGITISAPNGDISIKGKNVSIEAGNEVKIVSGQFIDEKKKAASESLADLAASGINSLVGTYLAPLTDFSLFRSIVDVLVKPISGTTTIKSGRYMLLMAGGGNAEIPNKGYSVTGLKKMEEENVKKQRLINTISYIDTKVDNWVSTAWALYDGVKTAAETYSNKPKLVSPSKQDLLNMLLSQSQPFTLQDNKITFEAGATRIEKRNIVRAANVARERASSLLDYCNKLKNAENVILEDKKYYSDEFKSVLKDALPDVITAIINKSEHFDKDEAGFKDCKTVFRRKIMEKLISKLDVIEQNPTNKADTVKFTGDASYTAANWGKYCSNLKKYTGATQSWIDKVTDSVKDAMTENLNPFATIAENKVWDTCKQGEILFSDKSGKTTVSMVNGALTSTPNNDELIDEIKEILKNY